MKDTTNYVDVRNICMFNPVKYSQNEHSVTATSGGRVGVIYDDVCVDILNGLVYNIYNFKEKNKETGYYAYIYNLPFKNIDEVIPFDELKKALRFYETLDKVEIFKKDKISKILYKDYGKKIKSLGYEIYENDTIYDFNYNRNINSNDIIYKSKINTKEKSSLNDIKKLIKTYKIY